MDYGETRLHEKAKTINTTEFANVPPKTSGTSYWPQDMSSRIEKVLLPTEHDEMRPPTKEQTPDTGMNTDGHTRQKDTRQKYMRHDAAEEAQEEHPVQEEHPAQEEHPSSETVMDVGPELLTVVLGTKVMKLFDGDTFSGEVTSIDEEEGLGPALYHVVYDDCDEEDLYLEEVIEIVCHPELEEEQAAVVNEEVRDNEEDGGDNYSAYTPMIVELSTKDTYQATPIPNTKRHEIVFQLSSSTSRHPLQSKIDDVVMVLNQTFLPDKLISIITKNTKAYAESKVCSQKRCIIYPADVLHFFSIYYYFGLAKLPAKKGLLVRE